MRRKSKARTKFTMGRLFKTTAKIVLGFILVSVLWVLLYAVVPPPVTITMLTDGNGITKQYGMGATPTYHDERLRSVPEGELFNVITHGKGNMLPYADKLSPEERWAVVLYVRALQRAQTGSASDVIDADAKKSLGLQ